MSFANYDVIRGIKEGENRKKKDEMTRKISTAEECGRESSKEEKE